MEIIGKSGQSSGNVARALLADALLVRVPSRDYTHSCCTAHSSCSTLDATYNAHPDASANLDRTAYRSSPTDPTESNASIGKMSKMIDKYQNPSAVPNETPALEADLARPLQAHRRSVINTAHISAQYFALAAWGSTRGCQRPRSTIVAPNTPLVWRLSRFLARIERKYAV